MPDRIAESVNHRPRRPSLSLALSTIAVVIAPCVRPVRPSVSSVISLVCRSLVLPVGRSSVLSVRPAARRPDPPKPPKRGHPGGDGWPPDGLLDTSTRPTPPQMPPQMPHLRRCADCVRLRGCAEKIFAPSVIVRISQVDFALILQGFARDLRLRKKNQNIPLTIVRRI